MKEEVQTKTNIAVSYLADGVRGGVVVAWWFAANPFAMFSLGGVTTLGDTNQNYVTLTQQFHHIK